MKDALFTAYQMLRKEAEDDITNAVHNWAIATAPDNMTISQLKTLTNLASRHMNIHTRAVFSLVESELQAGKDKGETE